MLIIHPGFHKSGTTALQQSLSRSREKLLDSEIWYPDLGGEAHHKIAFALSGRSWGWENQGGKNIPRATWQSLLGDIRKNTGTTLISTESLVELTSEQIDELSKELLDIDTKIVFTMRPLPSILVSIYQQYAKAGLQTDFSSWLESELQHNIHERKSRLWRRHSHDVILQRWLTSFPIVKLVVADSSQPEFLFDRFAHILNLPEKTLEFSSVSNVNRSLSLEELNLVKHINRNVRETMTWDEYLYFIRGSVRRATNVIPLDQAGTKMGLPTWAFDIAVREHERQWKVIQSLDIEIYSDDINRQIAQTLISENSDTETISVQIVAEMFSHFDFNEVVKKVSTMRLGKEFLVRLGLKRGGRILSFLTKLLNILRRRN